MFLDCCLRGPSKKKHKKSKIWKNETVRDTECSNVLSKSLISSTIISPKFIKPDLPALEQSIFSQEGLPSTEIKQEKEVHLHRQNKQPDSDSLQSCVFSTPFSKAPHKLISSSELINISNIPSKSQKLISQDVGLMFASAEDLDVSNLSVSNTHHSHSSHDPSFPPTPARPTSDGFITSTPHTKQNVCFDRKLEPSQTNINSVIQPEDFNKPNKILKERSPITEQIRNEEKNTDNESFLKKIKEEAKKELEDLKTQHQSELERVKQTFVVELQEVKESHRTNHENAKTNAKNEANETISNLNQQITLERGKLFFEQQNNSRHLEEEFKMKEDRFDKFMKEIEEREQTWQDERAQVLKEVQTLKAEATKMVKVLAMEYEEDLSEDKKRSLSQEVYSLQLVVEMRAGEVRNLRDHLARAKQQLEQAEMDKEKLKKATARMEDLEEQIKMKNNLERQLSLENSQLERHMTNTSKEVGRMSKNVEALQWRIKHNFDLPVDSLTPVISDQEYQRTSLPTFFADQQRSCTDWMTKNLIGVPVTDNQRKSPFIISDGITKATTKIKDGKNDSFAASNAIDECKINSINRENSTDSNVNENEVESDSIKDVESLDEGVGDISSDGEQPDSPNFDTVTCDKNYNLPPSEQPDNNNTVNSKTSSPIK